MKSGSSTSGRSRRAQVAGAPRSVSSPRAPAPVRGRGKASDGAGAGDGRAGAAGEDGGPGRQNGREVGQNVDVGNQLSFGPLGNYVGYALRRAQMSSVTGFLDVMKEVDLRPTQFTVMTLINENPGVRQNDICLALGLQKANFVPLLNELQRRGLAVRKEGVADRRSSALHLTAAGVALLQRALELHTRWEMRILDRVGTRGRDQLLVLLKKLI